MRETGVCLALLIGSSCDGSEANGAGGSETDGATDSMGDDGSTATSAGAEEECLSSADDLGGTIGETVSHSCPQECSTAAAIWGTDSYTSDSPICVAAIHAGVVPRLEGGPVIYELVSGLNAYEGSSRNGVTSMDRGASELTFSFVEDDSAGTCGGEGEPCCGGIACAGANLTCVDGTCAAEPVEPMNCDGNQDGVAEADCDSDEDCVPYDGDDDGVNDDRCATDRYPCDANADGIYQGLCPENFQCVRYDSNNNGMNDDFCVGIELSPCDGNGDGLFEILCLTPPLICVQEDGEDACTS